MATSGTVAQTVLDTAVVMEHAVRRCGIPASMQTPETVEICRQNLYLLLLNLANRGINLWCVEKIIMGLETNKATYALEDGTIRLMDTLYSAATISTGTDTVAADNVITNLAAPVKIIRWGFKLNASVTGTIALEYSTDGVTYTSVSTTASTVWTIGWYWYDLDPAITAQYWRVTSSVAATFDEFALVSAISDTPMTQFNRTEYAQQTNKTNSGRPSTNFYFNKTVAPTITLWPVPNTNTDQVTLWRHRFVQDVGTLTQQIEVPQQWMEAVIWMLAARVSYEIPGVDAARRTEVIQASERFLMEAELGETDNAPIFLYSGVSVYTR
jgi:hypothetical protein